MNLKILKIIGIPDNNSATVIHNDGLFRQFALFFDSMAAFEVHVKDARCMTEVFEFPKNCFCCDWVNF
jgi:hypothetical protein